MDWTSLTVTAVAAALAGFTQGFAGFGSTLVALPLLGLILPVTVAVPACCLMAMAMNGILTFRLRRQVDWRMVARMLAWTLPGMAAGGLVLGLAPDRLLKAALGTTILAISVLSWRTPAERPKGGSFIWLAGFTAGVGGVCMGINGPQITAWATRQPFTRDGGKAFLVAFFLVAGFGNVGTQALNGLVNADTLRVFLTGAPALTIGVLAGSRASGLFSEEAFRKCVLALLAVTGAVLVAQSF